MRFSMSGPKSRWRRRRRPMRACARARRRHATDRRADRAQGHLRHQGFLFDGLEQDPARLPEPVRRHGRRKPDAGRHGDAGQANCDEFAMGSSQREQCLRQRAQSVGRWGGSGRLVRRLRGRGGRAPGAGRHRDRYRRLDSRAGGVHRHHGDQAHLRPAIALGHDRLRIEPRYGRA